MNWYQIFYWVTVADGVKSFFDFTSNLFSFFSVVGLIITGISIAIYGHVNDDQSEKDNQSLKYWIRLFKSFTVWMIILATITWAGYVFTPSKKDALVIIAGGSVGKFLTSDSSAKQIPSEVTSLLRNKIRELNEYSLTDNKVVDTLSNLSREELIEIIKKK